MKVLCPHQTLPFPAALQGSPTELGAAPLHQIPAASWARRGWAAPATTKLQQEAWKTPGTGTSAKLVLTGIPPPRERLRCAQIGSPTGHRQSLNSVYKLSDAIKTLREKENGLTAAWAAEGMDYLQKKLELVSEEVGVCLQYPRTPACGCPALCTLGMIPWEREHGLTPTTPSTQLPRAIQIYFWKES